MDQPGICSFAPGETQAKAKEYPAKLLRPDRENPNLQLMSGLGHLRFAA